MTRLAAAGLAAAPAASPAWKSAFAEQLKQDLLGHWQSERDYSLAIVGAMPGPEIWLPARAGGPHLRRASRAFCARAQAAYFSRLELIEPPKPPEGSEAAEVKAFVAESFDYVRKVLEKAGEQEFLRRDVQMGRSPKLHTTQDLWLRGALHTAHHRGQLIVYLRLNGIGAASLALRATGGDRDAAGWRSASTGEHVRYDRCRPARL